MNYNENDSTEINRKTKIRTFFNKVPAFFLGFILGGAIVFIVMVVSVGLTTIFPSLDPSPPVIIVDIVEKIEACSDLTVTKFHYAGLMLEKDSKSVPTPLGPAPLPFTENSILVAYKGTIGLGFDISAIEPKVDNVAKTITIELPKLGVLYDEFDNANTQSFVITNELFSRSKNFDTSNELIGRLKLTEENSVLKNESIMNEAQKNAENVIRNVVSGIDSSYQVVFK